MATAKFFDSEKLNRLFLSLRYGFVVPGFDNMMNDKKNLFLYDTVMRYKGTREHVVEIGSYRGCSTTWLAIAAKRSNFKSMIAIDLFTGTPSWNQNFDTFDDFTKRIKRNHLQDFVQPIRGNSKEVIKNWDKMIAILHIDGDHSYDAVKADIDNYTPFVIPGGIVIFDDYDSEHSEVKKAVHELLNNGNFQILDMVPETKIGFGSIALQKIF